jgi:hypothetical protein
VGVLPPPGAVWRQRVGVLGLIAATLFVAGCGAPDRRLPEEAQLAKDEATKKSNDQVVHSEGGTVTIYVGEGGDRKDYFTVTWKKAEVDFNLKDAEFGGQIQEVSGTIVEKGEVQSTFVAREGSVDKGARRLNLAGGVKLTSKINDSSLVSEMLAYDGDSGVVEAAKGIEANMSGISIKGMERIAANVDLSEVWNDMKSGKKKVSLLPAIASVSIASGSAAMVKVQGLDIEMSGQQLVETKRLPNARLQITISGKPVTVAWKSVGTTFTGAEVTAIVSEKNRALISAQATGGITFTAKRQGDTVTVKAPSVSYLEATQRLDLGGAFTLDRKTAKGDHVHATGTGGFVVLDRQAKELEMVKNAELKGPVIFKVTGKRLDSETEKEVPFYVNASGNLLTYSESTRKAVLSGNVKLDGNDPSIIGTMSGIDRLEITLTPDWEVDSISMRGAEGKTIIQQTTGGGGGGGGGRRK